MRWIAVLVLLGSLVPLPATGQAPAGVLLTDGAADTVLLFASNRTVPTQDSNPEADLLSLAAVEEDRYIVFTIQVSGMDGSVVLPMSYFVRFFHGTVAYQAEVTTQLDPQGAAFSAWLELGHDEFGGRPLEEIPFAVDAAAATVTVEVPKARLIDERGAAPFPGRPLTGLVVYAQSFPVFGFDASDPNSNEETLKVLDHMPDDVADAAAFEIALGDPQSGDAALSSSDPTRASNGEATTYAFNVTGFNEGAGDADFELSAEGVPEGWEVLFPLPFLRIPAGGQATANVLVSIPFTHDHGEFESFRAVLTKEGDPDSRGTVTLGIRYTDPAQPAGHHDTLYWHVRAGSSTLEAVLPAPWTYFNTLQEDPLDLGQAIPARTGCGDGVDTRRYFWPAELDPRLAMGLDFDLERVGNFHATITAQRPMLGATVEGRIMHSSTGIVATFGPSAPEDLMRDDDLVLDLEIAATPESDLIPYEQDAFLYAEIILTAAPGQVPSICADAGSLPLLQPGAAMQLPLDEYHEVIRLSEGDLFDEGAIHRTAAPGSVLVFKPTLAEGDGRVGLEVFGVNDEWADLVGPTAVRLADDRSEVQVQVTIPESAVDSDRVDLILKATPTGGEPSFTRLVVDIDPDAEMVQEAGAKAAQKDAPAPHVVFLLAALFALVARRRSATARSINA